MFKNVASQKIQLFAFDITTGAPKTGDAANLTAYVSKDHGAVTVLGDTSATEMDNTNAKGVYVFDLTQGETNADELTFTAKSSTGNISITPRFLSTDPPSFTAFVTPTGAAVNATQLAGQTITAAAGVTFPTSVASPTNITAGTITTVTTITGLTASDVGAIKTKTDFLPSATAGAAGGVFIAGTNAATAITTALTANVVGNVTGNLSGSVGSVTGAVGSVTGAVGSVATGGISAASFAAGAIDAAAIATDAIDADAIKADAVTEIQAGLSTAAALATAQGTLTKLETTWVLDGAVYQFTANALELGPSGGTPPTVGAIADAVWDELLSGHAVSGSTGEALSASGTSADPWIATLPGAYGAGSAGFIVGTNLDALISSRTKPADTQAAVTTVTNLTNAPTAGDFTATMKTSLNAATPTVTAGTVTDKTGYALTPGERTSIAAAVWANVMEGSRTAIQYMRGFGAALLGKASGMATTTATFRDVDDSKDRIVATVDADGNRSAITLDLT